MSAAQLLRRGAGAFLLGASAPPPSLPIATADRALLAKVLADSRVDQSLEAPPSSYLRDAFVHLVEWLTRWWAARGGGALPLLAKALPIVLLAALALVLILLAVRLLRARPARPVRGELGAPVAEVAGPAPEWSAEDWRRERIRALSDGRLSEALVATWWWLARSLVGSRAEEAWTSRDLLAAAHRPDLRRPVALLEAFRYGPLPPQREAVAGLVEQLEANLS